MGNDEEGEVDTTGLRLNAIENSTSEALKLLRRVLEELQKIEQRLDSLEKKLR